MEGRTIIVTGGSRGIGRSVVQLLINEGANVATCARTLDDLKRLSETIKSSTLMTGLVDVLDEQAMRNFIDDTAKQFGRIDGLLANAGSGITGKIQESTHKDWIDQLSIKIFSITNLVMPALRYLRRSDAARIAIINSITGDKPEPTMAVVSAARAAVGNLAQTLALELAPEGINVNTINLGAIETERQYERFRKSNVDLPFEQWCQEEAKRRQISMGRYGQPAEVAPFIALCLSPSLLIPLGRQLT